jgi:membrane protease YdiL (CAAX protease family)
MQLIQLIILIGVLFFFFVSGIGYVLITEVVGLPLSGIAEINSSSPANVLQAAFVLQVLFQLGVFLMPPLLFAYFTHPRPKQYLGLRAPGKPIHWLLVITLMLGAMPLFLQLESWIKMFNWGTDVFAKQEKYEESINAMLNMPDLAALLKVFVIMAVLPAIGEELLFRGIFMRFAAQRGRGMVFPVFISAIMFAMVHGNIFGGTSIFLAGILLAVIYYLTGSIYCSMLGHLLNNGLQIILLYIGKDSEVIKAIEKSEQLPAFVPIAGLVLFSVSLFLLLKNKTPLPPNWADDYAEGELSENAV